MIPKTMLCVVAALALALSACGDRPKPAAGASSKPPSAQPSAYGQAPPDDAQDGDGILREIERTVSRPVSEPMMPLLVMESAEPQEGASR